MKTLTRATITALGLLPFSLFADQTLESSSSEVFRDSRVIGQIQQGKKTGGQIDAMVPFYGNNTHFWYGNIQAYKYGEEYETYSAGIGHRGLFNNAIYGAYGFYDWQKTPEKAYRNRVTMGVERLGETWDVRANFYLYMEPNRKALTDKGRTSATINGNAIEFTRTHSIEQAYNGANFEVGRTLGLKNLRGYVGYYAYGSQITGANTRIEYQYDNRITLTASTQHDNARGWLTTAGVSYWLGKERNTGKGSTILDRMRDPVVRDMTAAVKVENQYSTEVSDTKIYFASPNATASNGAGTESSPMSLSDAVATAGTGDIIYLEKGDGTAYDISDGLSLKQNQTLWGGVSDLSVEGFTIKTGSSSNRPTLQNGTITLDKASTIDGITYNGANSVTNGISISHSSGTVTVNDVNFTGTYGTAAISATGSSTTNLTDNTINATSASIGINVQNTASVVTIDNLTLTGNYSGTGIYVDGSNADATIKNSSITNSDDDAIYVNDGANLTLQNSTLTSSNDYGLLVRRSSTATISDSTFTANGKHGMYVRDGSTVTASNSTFSANTLDGISVEDSGSSLTLTGSTVIANNGRDGIFALDSASVTMTGGSIYGQSSPEQAIEVQSNATVTINNPVRLEGDIKETGSGSQTITVNVGDDTYTVSDGGNTSLTCSITDSSGSCS